MERETYPTDLTDAQWKHVIGHLPSPKLGGRPPSHSRREILNAIFYVVRSGCAEAFMELHKSFWRLLPHDFPPWKTVYHYFRDFPFGKSCWRIDGTMEKLNAALRTEVRQKAGREPQPSAAIIDSQSVFNLSRRATGV